MPGWPSGVAVAHAHPQELLDIAVKLIEHALLKPVPALRILDNVSANHAVSVTSVAFLPAKLLGACHLLLGFGTAASVCCAHALCEVRFRTRIT